jgi:hypothetical protein
MTNTKSVYDEIVKRPIFQLMRTSSISPLLRKVGANVVGAACIIELAFLGGRAKLDVPLRSMISYES